MTYGLNVTVAPTEEPIALAEAKSHCGVTSGDTHHDTHLTNDIIAARAHIEAVTNRAIITQTRELILNHFPTGSDPIYIPFVPVQSVSSIYYIDTDGNSTLWASANYSVSTTREPGEIHRAWNESWPSIRSVVDAITITYVAGYGAQAAVPYHLRAAVLLLVKHWFDNRSAVEAGTMKQVPLAVGALLDGLSVGDEFTTYGLS